MPQFLIEREIPGAGAMWPQQLQGVAKKSCSVLRNLGPQIQWLQSYVTDNNIYCVYIAHNEEMGAGACPSRRLSRQPYHGNQNDDRSNHCRERWIALTLCFHDLPNASPAYKLWGEMPDRFHLFIGGAI